jgi:hypothetical protein
MSDCFPIGLYRKDDRYPSLIKDGQNTLKLLIEDECCQWVKKIEKDFNVFDPPVPYVVMPSKMTFLDHTGIPGFSGGVGQKIQTDLYSLIYLPSANYNEFAC